MEELWQKFRKWVESHTYTPSDYLLIAAIVIICIAIAIFALRMVLFQSGIFF